MRGIKIIIVDRNSLFLNIMKTFFKNVLGCTIIGIATNGESFLNMENLDHADIIFMDIEMSGINGFQSAIQIFEKNPQAKIIAVSMYYNQKMQQQLLDMGFKGYISKTSFYDDIIPAMKQVLQGDVYDKEMYKTNKIEVI